MTPPKGYRWVEVGERLEEEDQVRLYGSTFVTASSVGRGCPEANRYIRKLPPPVTMVDVCHKFDQFYDERTPDLQEFIYSKVKAVLDAAKAAGYTGE